MARFCPLFSGSSGNSIFVGDSQKGILFDIGRSAKQITQALESNEIKPEEIKGIFITHEHSDHIKGLRVFASRHGINVYSSLGTLSALDDKGLLTDKYTAYDINDGAEIEGMYIKSFRTPHDARESVGYVVEMQDNKKVAIVTDLGVMTDEIMDNIIGCDVVLIESNHDVGMLENGPYPYYLKRRILSRNGHLSNEACSNACVKLLNSGTTKFFLGHLSSENNSPDLAYQCVLSELQNNGAVLDKDFKLKVAPRENANLVTCF